MHTVQLLEFATLSVEPCGKALELTAGEETKGLFSRRDSRRSDSMDGGSNVFDRYRGEVIVGETEGANRPDSIKGENMSLLIKQGKIREEGGFTMVSESTTELSHCEQRGIWSQKPYGTQGVPVLLGRLGHH
ncbi:hypothetical protein IV203_021684 [Nitzschia inconspicua]|uniref:Uncharacterized protein n=1 Tax=Nitzschia inconspicua TaxID=303405 RepID=A0A9K3K532_9STRA|nr:hypothetical protein IV203_022763 [Nitzschia inconspicua]KAG7343676.1 hypothetical protein IV203_021684 [Nitzschia inconspicua]